MRLLLLLSFLLFSFSLWAQVDTFQAVVDTFELEIEMDSIDVEPPAVREMPDSIKVNEEDDFETAFKKYGQQIEWDSTNANAHFRRAQLLVGSNDIERFGSVKCDETIFQQAKVDFDKAIKLKPFNRKFYYERGEFFYNFLRYEEARDDYHEAYDQSWGHESKMKALAQRSITNCRLGRIEPCLRDLETALKQDPVNIDLLKAKSFAHLILKEYSLVIDHLNKILQLDSDNRFAHSNMAYTAIGLEKYEKAIEIYDQILETYGDDALSFGNIGLAKMKLGRFEEGLKDINRSLEMYPNNSFALKNRALIFFEMKKNDEACADLKRAKELGYTIEHGSDMIEMLFEKCLEVNTKPK